MPVLINSKFLLLRILPDEPEDLPIPCLAHLSALVEALRYSETHALAGCTGGESENFNASQKVRKFGGNIIHW